MQEPPVIHEPSGRRATAAVLWLHGLGADGHDFAPIVPELGAVRDWTRFIFPHAPVRPVSINFGMAMRAWYDIRDDGGTFVSDEDDLRESQRSVEAMIAEQVEAGIPPERIVLAGFSQGGAVALQTALRHPHRLAGLMALSTYLPLADTLAQERSAANARIPVFMAHGEQDPLIGWTGRRPPAISSTAWTTRSSGAPTRWLTRCARRRSGTSATTSPASFLPRRLGFPAEIEIRALAWASGGPAESQARGRGAARPAGLPRPRPSRGRFSRWSGRRRLLGAPGRGSTSIDSSTRSAGMRTPISSSMSIRE